MITNPLPGVIIDPSHPLSKGLVGYWLFNEGGGDIANDISGHGNHGRLMNMLPNTQGSKWQGSKFGGGLAFDGNNDYINCGSNSSLDITDAITVSAWVKGSGIGKIVNKGRFEHAQGDYDLAKSEFCLYVDGLGYPDGRHVLYFNTSNNVWVHIAVIYDGDWMRAYVNGILNASSQIGSHAIDTSDHDLWIGSNNRGNVQPSDYFNGAIDGVKIYNRALSAEDVKQLYLDPFCNLIDISIWQRVSLAGLKIPIAHNYYERLRA